MGTKENIAAARELLKPTPVKLHVIPVWLKRVMGEQFNIPAGMYSHDYIQSHFGDWLDHWGTTTFRGQENCFVSEPYLSTPMLRNAMAFAEAAGLTFELSPNSYWFPGNTTRLIFMEKDDNDSNN